MTDVTDPAPAAKPAYITEAEAAHRAEAAKRPNGSVLIPIGGILLVCGAIALVIGLLSPTFSDPGSPSILEIPGRPPVINAWKMPLIWAGAGGANAGFLTLIAGLIIRSVFFLPGRAVTNGEL